MKRFRKILYFVVLAAFIFLAVVFVGGLKKSTLRLHRSLPLGLEAEWSLTKSNLISFLLPSGFGQTGKFRVYDGSLYLTGKIPLLQHVEGLLYLAEGSMSGDNFRGELWGIPLTFSFHRSPEIFSFVGETDDPEKDLFSLSGKVENSGIDFSLKLPGREKISGEAKVIHQDDGSFRIEGIIDDRSLSATLFSPLGGEDFTLQVSSLPLSGRRDENISSSPKGEITISLNLAPGAGFELLGKLDHCNFRNYDVLTDIRLSGDFDGEKSIRGEFSTNNSIIDYQPFREIRGDYEISDSELHIRSLEFGKPYHFSGKITFASAPRADCQLMIEDARIEDLLLLGPSQASSLAAKGTIGGVLKVKGELPHPDISFQLKGEDGAIGKVIYDTARVRFGGRWPTAEVKESLISRQGVSYNLVGELNLAQAGKKEAIRSLRLVPREEVMVWDGWNITRSPEEEVSAVKEVGEDFRVAFKASGNGRQGEEEETEETALEYELGENRSLKMEMTETDEVVVLEHKIKF